MSDWPDDNPDADLEAGTARRGEHRLGARIDRSQETYRPSPYGSQRMLPHGTVSRDGMSAEPETSLTTRILVWGGAGIAAAAITAGGILAVRKVADLVAGDDDDDDREAQRAADRARNRAYNSSRGRGGYGSRDDRTLAPRFADMTEQERDRMRSRQRAREAEMDAHARAIRAGAREDRDRARGEAYGSRPRRPRPRKMGLLEEIEHTASRVSGGAESLVATLSAAMAGFRQVAGQASHVLEEFRNTADEIRGFIDSAQLPGAAGKRPARAGANEDAYRRPMRRDVVDLRDDAQTGRTSVDNARDDHGDHGRTHRL